MRQARRGFTLVELTVVLIILAVMGGLAVPAFKRLTNLFTALVLRAAKQRRRDVTVDPEAEQLLTEALKTSESDDQHEVVRLAKRVHDAAEETGTDRISSDLLFQHLPERYKNALLPPALTTVQ